MKSSSKPIDFSKKVYFKYDRPPKKGEPFTDPNFPPNENSLLGKDKNGEYIDKVEGEEKAKRINPKDIEWRRASEIFKGQKYLLFEDIIEMDDINQGSLGDCYFLASIAALCEYPSIIYNIFITKEINSEGYFELEFYIDGRFKRVIVDDYLPYSKPGKKIAYAQPNKNEIWVCILEKAWAKVNGGYSLIISGWMRHALQALTGYGHYSINLNKINPQRIWKLLNYADDHHGLISASSKSNVEDLKCGLVKSHAYTVPQVVTIHSNGEMVKLVQLRNTWGFKEWNGDWSDGSDKWGAEELDQITDFKNVNDGTFFMSFEDFLKHYIICDICYLQYSCHSKTFHIEQSNNEHLKGNVFSMAMPEDGFVTVNLMRKLWRFNRHLRDLCIPSFLAIFRIELENTVSVIKEFDCVYESYEDISISKEFKKGLYIIYCFRDYSKVDIKEDIVYSVKVDSTVDFRYNKMKSDDPQYGLPYLSKALLRYLSKKEHFKLAKEKTVLNLDCINTVDLLKSGLGIRLFYNENKTKTLHVSLDMSKAKNMCVISPLKTSENIYDLYIDPQSYGMILGLVEDSKKSGSFTSAVKLFYVKSNPNKEPEFDINDYEDFNLIFEEINPKTYYDRTSISYEEAKKIKQFETLDMSEMTEKNIEEVHPEYYALLKEMPPVENDADLTWKCKKIIGGEYIGQRNKNNKKEGRGVMLSKDKFYIGYWKDDVKCGQGKEYSLIDKQLIFEGEYKDNNKNGKGKFYYINGDIYEGDFVDDKKEGFGKHFFKKSGATWEGNFTKNKMNGEGVQTFASGKKMNVVYCNGALKK